MECTGTRSGTVDQLMRANTCISCYVLCVGFARAREWTHAHTTFMYSCRAHIHIPFVYTQRSRRAPSPSTESALHTADTLMSATVWRTYVFAVVARVSFADEWTTGWMERAEEVDFHDENRNRIVRTVPLASRACNERKRISLLFSIIRVNNRADNRRDCVQNKLKPMSTLILEYGDMLFFFLACNALCSMGEVLDATHVCRIKILFFKYFGMRRSSRIPIEK